MIKKLVVLSDGYYGSSGEDFVEACKNSKKVTVIWRATAGITDYSIVATKKSGDKFELGYPTSRDSRIDTSKGEQSLFYVFSFGDMIEVLLPKR